MSDELVALLDEEGEIAEFAVLHNEVDVRGGLDAVMEGNNVRVAKSLEDLNFSIQVFFELLVKTLELHGFDGNRGFRFLGQVSGR